jgi:leader peptidase (prepilin peptidase) / N-methyltransferase
VQLWLGAVGSVVVAVVALLGGPALTRWASGVDVSLPAAATVTTAAISGFVVGARIGLVPALAAFGVLAVGASILVGIDLRLHRLPDLLTGATGAAGLVLLGIAAAIDDSWLAWRRAILGGVAALAIYLLLFLVVRAGLGAGDVKLAGVLGLYLAWLGWPTLVLGTFAGFLAGGLVSLALLATRRATMETRVPFGPSMVAGALLAIAVGDSQAATLLGW